MYFDGSISHFPESLSPEFTGFNSFYYISAHHTYAINLGIVQATMPAFIVIISMIWLKTKIGLLQIFGLLVTLLTNYIKVIIHIICNYLL